VTAPPSISVGICSPSAHVRAALRTAIRTLDGDCNVMWCETVENLQRCVGDDDDRDSLSLLRHYPSRTSAGTVVGEHSRLRREHRWQGVFIALVEKETAEELAKSWSYGITVVDTDDLRAILSAIHIGAPVPLEQWLTARRNEGSVALIREMINKALAAIEAGALTEAADLFRSLREPLLNVEETIISHSSMRVARDLAASEPSMNAEDLRRIGNALADWAKQQGFME
jgi:hypothetical protein